MATINGVLGTSTAELLKQKNKSDSTGISGFADHLKNALNEENKLQVEGDTALGDIATGQVKDLHQAAMAIGKAETSMKLMLEIRNKALSAYKELGRTQL
jgi:flagellar hook-basal body complex protein FliE